MTDDHWVFNASPLILLGKMGRLDLVELLNPGFRIPAAVAAEVGSGPSGDPAKLWLETSAITGRVLESPQLPSELLAWDLGAGETAVLAHCRGYSGYRAVLDDRAARNCAAVFGIRFLGTLGVLIRAKRRGVIDRLEPELHRLVEVGSLLSTAVMEEALRLADE